MSIGQIQGSCQCKAEASSASAIGNFQELMKNLDSKDRVTIQSEMQSLNKDEKKELINELSNINKNELTKDNILDTINSIISSSSKVENSIEIYA